jgi:hypothetical protein
MKQCNSDSLTSAFLRVKYCFIHQDHKLSGNWKE